MTEEKQGHPIDMLREMLASEIARTSTTESFMIRSGLLADLLDELASLRISHSLPGEVGTVRIDNLAARKAVNCVLAPLLAPHISDMSELIEVGNQACTEILAALTPSALSGEAGEVERLRTALAALLARDMRNTCQHDETYRGGAIWEICSSCGTKWADDEGGRPDWQDPPEWTEALASLPSHQGPGEP